MMMLIRFATPLRPRGRAVSGRRRLRRHLRQFFGLSRRQRLRRTGRRHDPGAGPAAQRPGRTRGTGAISAEPDRPCSGGPDVGGRARRRCSCSIWRRAGCSKAPAPRRAQFARHGEAFATGMESLKPGDSADRADGAQAGALQLKAAATEWRWAASAAADLAAEHRNRTDRAGTGGLADGHPGDGA